MAISRWRLVWRRTNSHESGENWSFKQFKLWILSIDAGYSCLVPGSMFSKVIVLWRKMMLRSPIVMCQFHYCGQLGDKKEAHYSQIAYILVLIARVVSCSTPPNNLFQLNICGFQMWDQDGPPQVRVKTTAWFLGGRAETKFFDFPSNVKYKQKIHCNDPMISRVGWACPEPSHVNTWHSLSLNNPEPGWEMSSHKSSVAVCHVIGTIEPRVHIWYEQKP